MGLSVKHSGTWKTPTAVHVRTGGAWAAVQKVWVRSGGTWREAWSAFKALTGASASPATLSALDQLAGTIVVGPSVAAPVPADATGPITYAWQHVSGSTFTVHSPTAASTTFRYVAAGSGTRSGVYRCAVTQGGTTHYTGNVSISISWSNM